MSFENYIEDTQDLVAMERAAPLANPVQVDLSWKGAEGPQVEIDLTKTAPQTATVIGGMQAK